MISSLSSHNKAIGHLVLGLVMRMDKKLDVEKRDTFEAQVGDGAGVGRFEVLCYGVPGIVGPEVDLWNWMGLELDIVLLATEGILNWLWSIMDMCWQNNWFLGLKKVEIMASSEVGVNMKPTWLAIKQYVEMLLL